MHASDNDLNKLLINGRVRESRTDTEYEKPQRTQETDV